MIMRAMRVTMRATRMMMCGPAITRERGNMIIPHARPLWCALRTMMPHRPIISSARRTMRCTDGIIQRARRMMSVEHGIIAPVAPVMMSEREHICPGTHLIIPAARMVVQLGERMVQDAYVITLVMGAMRSRTGFIHAPWGVMCSHALIITLPTCIIMFDMCMTARVPCMIMYGTRHRTRVWRTVGAAVQAAWAAGQSYSGRGIKPSAMPFTTAAVALWTPSAAWMSFR